MPFQIKRVRDGYQVSNILTGVVYARHTTLSNAKRQVRLLHAIEHAFKPRNYLC